MPPRVLLADDHQMIRQHIRALLEEEGFEVVGEASNGRDAVQLSRHFQPDVAILDVSMPTLNGFAAAEEILRETPQTRIILLTGHTEMGYILRAIRAGVCGYVAKSELPADLLAAIQVVAQGKNYVSPIISQAAWSIVGGCCEVRHDDELRGPKTIPVEYMAGGLGGG